MAKEAAKKKEEAEEKEEKDAKKGNADEEEDAEGEGEEGAEGEGAPKPKSKKKLIIILILLLVLLGAAGGGAWFFFYSKQENKAAGGEAGGAQAGIGSAVFYTLPEFLVNLNTGGKQSSYLKMTVVLELAHQTDVISVEGNLPKLFDTLNTYLRELRASDLAGSAGIQRLREELLLRANQTLAPTKVSDILFKEIVVQ